MPPTTLLTDDELLSSDDPEAFGMFYDRHVKMLLGYFDTVQLGGQPRDAAIAGDSLVIADLAGALSWRSAGDLGQAFRIAVDAAPVSIAADDDVVWISSNSLDTSGNDRDRSWLLGVDARTGGELSRVPIDGYSGRVAVGAGGVWVASNLHDGGLLRVHPRSLERTAFVPDVVVEGLAVTDRAVWVRQRDLVTQLDAAGRVVHRVRGISPTSGEESQRTMLADPDGAWVVGQSGGLLYRIEGGRVIKRVAVGESAGAIARSGGSLWVSASPAIDRYELVRVDPDEGKVTGRVDLGNRMSQAIVPVGDKLWVITTAGEALLLSPE